MPKAKIIGIREQNQWFRALFPVGKTFPQSTGFCTLCRSIIELNLRIVEQNQKVEPKYRILYRSTKFCIGTPTTLPRNISMCTEVGCRDENWASKCVRVKGAELQLSLEGVGIVIKKKKKKTNIRHPTSELFSHDFSSNKKTDTPCAGTDGNIG